MDAVKATIESLGGSVILRTEKGQGTTTRLEVPITAAVQRVLLVAVQDECLAFPITKVEKILEVLPDEVENSGAESFTLVDGEPILLLDLAQGVRLESEPMGDAVPLVITEVRGERVAIRVSRFVSQQEIYVKPVPKLLSAVKVLAGMTILEDGHPVFLLDLNHLA